MRTLHWALLLALFVTLGCRSNPNQLAVEQESRMFEDEVYYLEAQLEDARCAREATIRENEELKKQLANGGSSPAASPRPSMPRGSATPPPVPGSGRNAPPLEAPVIELPEPSDSAPSELKSGGAPGDEQPVEGQPTKLSINKRLTGGLDRDNEGGDEGVMVVFEPRDEQGRLVKTPGAVSVVVMDPAETGHEARVARWDFQAHEVAEHFQNTMFDKGILFELPWTDGQPKHRNLQLFVRYMNADGTKLTSEVPLVVRMPSDSPRADGVENASRPTRKTAPNSRLKGRTSSREPRELSAADEETDDTELDDERRPARGKGTRQAARPKRPEWKPYR